MRTRFDPNEIICFDSFAEIVLYDKDNEEKARAYFDPELLELIDGVKWYLRPDGYVATSNYRGRGYQYFHAILFGQSVDANYIDHINGDRLDNRLSNLRMATPAENNANKHRRSDNTSGRAGVFWDKANQKWCASIRYNGRQITLGRYQIFEDAVAKRQEAEKLYFKEFQAQEDRLRA